MTFTIIQPADVEAAIDLLRRVPLLVDSPTQRRQRDPDGLSRAFAGGDFRRPDLVWAAVGDGGEPRAVVAGLLAGTQTVLDFFGADDEAALTAVVAAATAGVRDQEWPEACFYAPPGAGVDSPQLRPWVRALRDAGWDLLVERHHYDLAPHPGLAAPPADCPLRLEPLAGPEDPRLEPAVRDVLVGSLDVADRTLTARVGLERAAREAVRDLLASDPWQCLRLAYDDGPEPVGLVSWIGGPGGSGYVLLVGVGHGHRGPPLRPAAARARHALARRGRLPQPRGRRRRHERAHGGRLRAGRLDGRRAAHRHAAARAAPDRPLLTAAR